MSFTEQNMNVFSQRCKSFMSSLQNLRQEGAKLKAIYSNEAASGSDSEFVDTGGITKAEHIAAVVLYGDLQKFCENEAVGTADRQASITPFIQDA